MRNGPRKSMLCPNCRRIISADETRCPHCGMAAPGSRWKNNPLTGGWAEDDRLIRIIIFINIGMFLFSLVISRGSLVSGFNPLRMLTPSLTSMTLLGATGTWKIREVGLWTLVSANYLHAGLLHIFFNMAAFYQIAPLITRLFGAYRFFVIFTLSGVGGFLISCLMGITVTLGASAAICGLIGAAIYYGRSRGGLFGDSIYRQIGGWAIVIILFGFFMPQINNAAHIGGMICGGLTAMLLGYTEKSRENTAHRTLAALCMLTTLLILLLALYRGLRYGLLA
ncbi:MAG: rhomboid family intramembrane serine protease [Desulfobacteraceae bacterium]